MALTTLTFTVPGHGLNIGDQIFIEGVIGFNGALNNQTFTVQLVTPNTFVIVANVSYSYQTGGRIHKFVSSVTGPSYLNGQMVTVVTNGQTVNSLPYNNGVTLPAKSWNVVVGLPYQWRLKFLPLGGDGQDVNQGKQRKLYDVVLRVWQSLGGKFGIDENNLFALPYDNPDNQFLLNVAPNYNPLATGDVHAVGFDSQFDDYCTPFLEDNQPFPFMLLAAILRSEISEDK